MEEPEHSQEFTDPSRHVTRREHPLRTPTSQLSHEQKVERQALHLKVLTGVLLLVLAMLAYSAAFDLDSAAEWIVFGGICFTAVGVAVAVHTAGR
jgi:hypothetical protein